MKNIWFSNLYLAIPVIAVLVMISAQLFPHFGPPLYKVKPAMATVIGVHPGRDIYGSPERYKDLSVTYYSFTKEATTRQRSRVSENRRVIGDYNKGDVITVYHFPSRPHQAFLDEKSPPQFRVITQIGFLIFVFWIALLWRNARRIFFNSLRLILRDKFSGKSNSSNEL